MNASTGVAGFVFPGDHVDLVLTQQVDGGGDGPPLKVSETIVRNVRVLATDQRITDKDEDGKTEVKTFSNVTFEVTPRIAEKIAVAQSIGTLSLSLRSIADNTPSSSAPLPRATSRSRRAPIRRRRGRCCSRSPIARSTPTRPSPPAATCRASSAAPSLPRTDAASGGAGHAPAQRSARLPARQRRFAGPVVRVARGNNVTVVPVGAR